MLDITDLMNYLKVKNPQVYQLMLQDKLIKLENNIKKS